MEKTTKYLRCHTAAHGYKVGDRFAVINEEYGCYFIADHGGYSKEPDGEGLSYATWFTLEPDADSAPTTLLPDESLGGVLREYREVKRKACVGELAKITDNNAGHRFSLGETVRFTREKTAEYLDKRDWWAVGERDYVVLEASDILRIDDADGVSRLYRMVDRKAAVGERVIATEHCAIDPDNYGPGSVFSALDSDFFGVDIMDLNGEPNAIPDGDYRVLEPLITAELPSTPTPLSSLPLVDQYAENITVLTRKIIALEERNTALESRILALETDSAPACVEVASGSVDTSVLSALPTYVKSAQQFRDEIVERAKADVSDLRKFSGKQIPNDSVRFWPETKLPHAYISLHSVEFVVNSAKRTVVAIIRCTADGMTTRGIAKCAPGDVFNAALGRAIALYRALGLEVPAEYLACPQPTEIRVGDVVSGARPRGWYSVDCSFTITSGNVGGTYKYAECPTDWIDAEQIGAITDDSREDGGISASPSALKGAA